MKVAIVKYNAGNTRSVANALNRLGVEPVITDAADELRSADKVIFPGVGEASTAMRYLRERSLDRIIPELGQPVLAICLGMQLLGTRSDENGSECLDIIPYETRKFTDDVRVPHTGWNEIGRLTGPLFTGIDNGSRVYFVHSYYVEPSQYSIASTEHGSEFSAAVNLGNFFGVQFHPEKSASVGQRVLSNFLAL